MHLAGGPYRVLSLALSWSQRGWRAGLRTLPSAACTAGRSKPSRSRPWPEPSGLAIWML
ncbi:hypothetical protein PEC18_06015 [Paucibacter sp. O1-1]|nr:hypothetical protein [Paucibacter sp. O1-1]MDA3825426.1 hypothetical protein [Paucibacter sp. O1-1]